MAVLQTVDREVLLLARVLGNNGEPMPVNIATYLVELGFNQRDKDRMHYLAVRNQADGLSEDEKGELIAYTRTGSVLSILKSKARRALKPVSNPRPSGRNSVSI